MTPREKVLRDCVKRIAKLGGKEIDDKPTCLQCCESLASCDDDNPWCPGRQARSALSAADAIPDAPAELEAHSHDTCPACPHLWPKPVPSRAELIELMCAAFKAPNYMLMGEVLDALIKAGVVHGG